MSHYFLNDASLKEERQSFTYQFNNESFNFTTDNGVFSKERVDFGSYLLIKQAASFPPGKHLLDLGCGFGAIGIVMKRLFPETEVDAVDINERAVELTRLNAENNDVKICTMLTSDITELDRLYETILLNPPIHSGKQAVFDLYEKAHRCLAPEGCLYIVIKKKHGAESTLKKLKDLFNDTEILHKEAGYWVIRAVR
ncbi:MAG: class I SAM-dependent methyltransferase [Erysipelotrichaceae bacterium]|nr:class I SAM-dependent methyltransferase [Erysipelotrichaceae bacterium]MBQ1809723.1 class I SAM-dependent methyltransferase [Erysipelotrichaceae bacterium]